MRTRNRLPNTYHCYKRHAPQPKSDSFMIIFCEILYDDLVRLNTAGDSVWLLCDDVKDVREEDVEPA